MARSQSGRFETDSLRSFCYLGLKTAGPGWVWVIGHISFRCVAPDRGGGNGGAGGGGGGEGRI